MPAFCCLPPLFGLCLCNGTPSQSTSDFLFALSRCFEDLGGVPQLLVPDNLKAAVVRADRYEPDINQALEDFANHYRTAVLPARVRKPQDKALVENQVKILYPRIYAKLRNMQFFDLVSLNQAIRMRVRAHNQTRMQKKPYCREEKFLAEEKTLLTSLPEERFELRNYTVLTVAKNNHIYLSADKRYYSVPHTLIGCKVKVVYTRSMLYAYHEGRKVAVHSRTFKEGIYSTVEEHLCSHHRHYKDRSPEYYRHLSARISRFYAVCMSSFEQKDIPNRFTGPVTTACTGKKIRYRNTRKGVQDNMENGVFSYKFSKYHRKPHGGRVCTGHDISLPKHGNLRADPTTAINNQLKF